LKSEYSLNSPKEYSALCSASTARRALLALTRQQIAAKLTEGEGEQCCHLSLEAMLHKTYFNTTKLICATDKEKGEAR